MKVLLNILIVGLETNELSRINRYGEKDVEERIYRINLC